MKGSIRFSLLILGIIAMVACVFDSGDTKTDRGYDVVLSQDRAMSVEFGVNTGYDFTLCAYVGNGELIYNELSFKIEKFYIKNHESKDLFEIEIGNLAAIQFG